MGRNSRAIKNRAIELLEGFDEAMDEKFSDEFRDFIKPMLADNDVITYDDIQGFLDSFETLDENEWAFEQVDAELAEIGDQKYQQWKDER